MRIFLVGMMGSGKTKLGKKLASVLSLNSIDMDEYIEHQEDTNVSSLFRERGEQAFRRLEHEYLMDVLKLDQIVVSTGGGLPCFMDNMAMMNDSGVTLYLEASPGFLKSRLINHKVQRPLIASISDDDLELFLEKMLQQRQKFYSQARYTLSAKSLKANDIVAILKNKK